MAPVHWSILIIISHMTGHSRPWNVFTLSSEQKTLASQSLTRDLTLSFAECIISVKWWWRDAHLFLGNEKYPGSRGDARISNKGTGITAPQSEYHVAFIRFIIDPLIVALIEPFNDLSPLLWNGPRFDGRWISRIMSPSSSSSISSTLPPY